DSIRQIVRVLRISSRHSEKRAGLSGAQLFVLQSLSGEKALSINELAERTFTHQSSVSAVVSKLVERGLLSRAASPGDARRAELALTASGRAMLREAPRAAQEQLVAAIGKMPAKHRESLAHLISTLVEESGFSGPVAPMLFEDEK
ncbi:MAG: MarR family winged helix-turn-helix transcriptional regulator, partial [Bdellovibrionota bacterium]